MLGDDLWPLPIHPAFVHFPIAMLTGADGRADAQADARANRPADSAHDTRPHRRCDACSVGPRLLGGRATGRGITERRLRCLGDSGRVPDDVTAIGRALARFASTGCRIPADARADRRHAR